MAGTLSEHKRRWGMAAYVATTLRLIADIRSTMHVITIDGVEYDANAAMVLVANCGEVIPPFVRLRPGSAPTMDCSMWSWCGPTASARASGPCGICSGRSAARATPSSGYARGREIRVETDPVQPVQLDGEPGGRPRSPPRSSPAPSGSLVPGRLRHGASGRD